MFADPLTFPPVPPAGQTFLLFSELSHHLFNGLAINPTVFGDPLTFPLVPTSGQNLILPNTLV